MFVVHWLETEHSGGSTSGDMTLAALCHVAGNTDRARFYLQRRVEEAKISYEDLYWDFHKEQCGSWWHQFWGKGRSEEEVVDLAKGRFEFLQKTAEAASKLATGLGIRLDYPISSPRFSDLLSSFSTFL